ncbi:cytochrome-c peroxidase [Nonlabens tegetincola]|uniref:cytochrome-c peroxidase n=1 Tax=Nonlabens tegetincola TaxID=323273 RepID=UPI000CF4BDE2|nr:cytochrome c peroxidase [Nonlabens tegetincola]PQJ17310.1 cytochrome-c peroxidase [Nonlabens tegetincola]
MGKSHFIVSICLLVLSTIFIGCQESNDEVILTEQEILNNHFTNISLSTTLPYQNTQVPNYIRFVNTGNDVENEKAQLGRVLFYDKNLSIDNSISCASCHIQSHAFGDLNMASIGVNGITTRHSMRLVNAGYRPGTSYFWDERASSLEDQVLQPIQDHIEMGFSGSNDSNTLESLVQKLQSLEYYPVLFKQVYGNEQVTTEGIQESLANFVLSIQSFDSKFDEGLVQTGNINTPFPNFTPSENRGKRLFNTPAVNGGAGCVSCHAGPEFAIRDDIHNNGVIGVLNNPNLNDHDNTRSPSLRDLTDPMGNLNGPLMHDASLSTLLEIVNHYNQIDIANQQLLDPLLFSSVGPTGPVGQDLQLTETQKEDLINFLRTLSGNSVYTDEKWSNPFIQPN